MSDDPETDPRARLADAWSSLAGHCFATLMGHHSCCGHTGARSAPPRGTPGDTCFIVPLGSSCQEAATGVPGEVRVDVASSTALASTGLVPLAPLGLDLIVAGTDPSTPAGPYAANYHQAAGGADVVVVQTPANNPRGLYLGQVGSGSAGSPVVIYLDGL